MSVKLSLALAAALTAAAWASGASAGVVLSDNFDGPVAQGNWSGDAVFLSIPQPGNAGGMPSVDLVGPGFFDSLAYAGNSVDLDGSTGGGFSPAGELQSVASLPTGDYTVSFLLAGNLRGAANQTTVVSIGGQSINVTPSNDAQPYTAYSLNFTGASGKVAFTDLGPADQQGDLLDNVAVSTNVVGSTTGVPEPMGWVLMLAGIGGVGGALRSRRGTAPATA